MSQETIVKQAEQVYSRLVASATTMDGEQVLATIMVAQSIDRLTELLRPIVVEVSALIDRAKAEEAAERSRSGAKR